MSLSASRRERKNEWQRKQRAKFVREHGFSTASHYATAGMREQILVRDGYACVRCGMTDAEHKARWGRPITIDHKSKDRSDNSPENLQTLCLTCHGSKDLIPRLRVRKGEAKLPEMLRLRAEGLNCTQIAARVGLSLTTVWKYLQRNAA